MGLLPALEHSTLLPNLNLCQISPSALFFPWLVPGLEGLNFKCLLRKLFTDGSAQCRVLHLYYIVYKHLFYTLTMFCR